MLRAPSEAAAFAKLSIEGGSSGKPNLRKLLDITIFVISIRLQGTSRGMALLDGAVANLQ
jgi:hypothetical protein